MEIWVLFPNLLTRSLPCSVPVVITWRGEGYHYMMRLGQTVKREQLVKVKAQVSSIWAKGYILMIVCECYLTNWLDITTPHSSSLVERESHGILLLFIIMFNKLIIIFLTFQETHIKILYAHVTFGLVKCDNDKEGGNFHTSKEQSVIILQRRFANTLHCVTSSNSVLFPVAQFQQVVCVGYQHVTLAKLLSISPYYLWSMDLYKILWLKLPSQLAKYTKQMSVSRA